MKYYCNVKLIKLIPYILYYFYNQKKYSSKNKTFKNLNIKTKFRSSTVLPLFNFVNFHVYNGKNYINVFITPNKFYHKLGEFSFSKIPARHNKKKKKKR